MLFKPLISQAEIDSQIKTISVEANHDPLTIERIKELNALMIDCVMMKKSLDSLDKINHKINNIERNINKLQIDLELHEEYDIAHFMDLNIELMQLRINAYKLVKNINDKLPLKERNKNK